MRLVNTETLQFCEFSDQQTPSYAILSHRWCDDELSLQDFLDGSRTDSAGHGKVLDACRVARARGYEWIWIDSICIDKRSSAELTEAINSMFNWYKESTECLTYLSDVLSIREEDITDSAWFTRGWCLQELLAPRDLTFFNAYWDEISTKEQSAELISSITGINEGVLCHPQRVFRVNIAQRMSWASGRVTTRSEDMAYSLLGIFDVNMALLYGEGGKKAFARLQLEIIKNSADDSIFAWAMSTVSVSGMLAPSPRAFAGSGDVQTFARPQRPNQRPWTWTNLGLEMWLPQFGPSDDSSDSLSSRSVSMAPRDENENPLFGRDLEILTLNCWKSTDKFDDGSSYGWHFRERVLKIRLKRYGASWRRVNCNEFLLGVQIGHSALVDSVPESASETSFLSLSTTPTSYRLVYVKADTWTPYTRRLSVSGEAKPLLSNSDNQELGLLYVNMAWDKRNVMAFDSGDIGTYWSLLAMDQLMQCVAQEEENHPEPHYHSFLPQPFRLHSPLPRTRRPDDATYSDISEEAFQNLESTRRFLPCHYFDEIGGAGFGGLAAIMLSRLRMDIASCLDEFEGLAADIFSDTQSNEADTRRGDSQSCKYSSGKIEDFFSELSRRCRWNESSSFAAPGGSCATFVTAVGESTDDSGSEEVYIIRSSDWRGFTSGSKSAPLRLEQERSGSTLEQNSDNKIPGIGLVAKLAVASPGFFDSNLFDSIKFEHGGFRFPMNPTFFGLREYDTGSIHESTGTVVSIGTAVVYRSRDISSSVARSYKPEAVHHAVDDASKRSGIDYYRLNPEVTEDFYHLTLDRPDEWNPVPSATSEVCGSQTIRKIKGVFNRWLANPDVQNHFTECAQSLVGRRRRRIQSATGWAIYVNGDSSVKDPSSPKRASGSKKMVRFAATEED